MKNQLISITAQFEKTCQQLIKEINNLPESTDGVKMLAKNCCTVPISLIREHGFNLSPRYWLSHETKKQLIQQIQQCTSTKSLINIIDSILKAGKLKNDIILAPNILEALRKIWEK